MLGGLLLRYSLIFGTIHPFRIRMDEQKATNTFNILMLAVKQGCQVLDCVCLSQSESLLTDRHLFGFGLYLVRCALWYEP